MGTYGAYGYGLPYAGVYGGYRTYGAPYSYGYYGKRSADAEPEADAEADPALLYGAYGYGLPYSGVYGYRTYGAYPYTYGYYGKRSADTEPTDMASPTLASTDTEPMVPTPMPTATTARGLLMLSLRLMPRLTPLSFMEPTDMASPTLVSTDTEPMVPTPIPTATTARGPLMPSLRIWPPLLWRLRIQSLWCLPLCLRLLRQEVC